MSGQGLLFNDCPHARGTVVPEKRGIHHAKMICSNCGKFMRWMPKPETVERHRLNAIILSALAKIPNLGEWERNFVRDMASHKNISPKQQAMLLKLEETHLKGGAANDGFHGETMSPNRNPSD